MNSSDKETFKLGIAISLYLVVLFNLFAGSVIFWNWITK